MYMPTFVISIGREEKSMRSIAAGSLRKIWMLLFLIYEARIKPVTSDFMVKDGSYIRLKEVRLTYNFSNKLTSRWHLTNLSMFVGAYNLLTLTGYNGFDPEVGKVSGTESNNLSMGVDHGNYPQARSFTFGLNITL